ncbi:MAG: hypothetical protein QNJ47_16505 [Nostocaceae cyanobacterium]|nr:hypothetical protein [Nostocaceae cyanobacterium]
MVKRQAVKLRDGNVGTGFPRPKDGGDGGEGGEGGEWGDGEDRGEGREGGEN